jgi:hypothetical protein
MQKAVYSLTEMAIALVPVFAHLGAWGRKWLPVSKQLAIRAQLLEEGGPKMWEQFMVELRCEHLGKKPRRSTRQAKGESVRDRLEAGYQAMLARFASQITT